jgi:hypothetical protein
VLSLPMYAELQEHEIDLVAELVRTTEREELRTPSLPRVGGGR